MCKNCYEKYVDRTGKEMLFCKLRINENASHDSMFNLCICQRYCSDKEKYIPHNQRENCKYYED